MHCWSWIKRNADVLACACTSGVLADFINALSGRRDVGCVKLPVGPRAPRLVSTSYCPLTECWHSDPFLSHQFNLLEIPFAHMSTGLAILDRGPVLRHCNPTWARLIAPYTPSTSGRVVPEGACESDQPKAVLGVTAFDTNSSLCYDMCELHIGVTST